MHFTAQEINTEELSKKPAKNAYNSLTIGSCLCSLHEQVTRGLKRLKK